MILHNSNRANPNMIRRDFLKELIQELVESHLRVRLAVPTLRRDLRVSMEAILEEQASVSGGSALTEKKQARCVLCPRVAYRKTKTACERCHRRVCEEHNADLCSNCSVVE